MALHKKLPEDFNSAVFSMPKDISSVMAISEKLYLSTTQNKHHEGMALALCLLGNLSFFDGGRPWLWNSRREQKLQSI